MCTTTPLRNASPAPLLIARTWRREVLHGFFVFVVALTLYAYTAPRTVALEDDGLFLLNLRFSGVGHPPGYPLHTLLGSLFVQLPLGSFPFRGHLFSGLCGALSCAVLHAVIAMLVRGRVFAYVGSIGFALSPVFWSQSIIAEVYTLNTLLVFALLALSLDTVRQRENEGWGISRRRAAVLGLVYGLSLSNHWPLVALATPGVLLLFWSRRRAVRWRSLVSGAVGLLVGLTPYAWLVWRSNSDPEICFYGPFDSLADFWYFLSRRGYSTVEAHAGADWGDTLQFLWALTVDWVNQFTVVGFALSLVGMWRMLRSRGQAGVAVALLVMLVMSSFALVGLLDLEAEFITYASFRVFPLVAYGVTAVFMSYGAAALAGRLGSPTRGRRVLYALAVASLAVLLGLHWRANNRRDDRWARDFATLKLELLDANADLFLYGDLDFPLAYLNRVEGIREDIRVFSDQGVVLRNRLFKATSPVPERKLALEQHIRGTKRPVFYNVARSDVFGFPRWGTTTYGFHVRIDKQGQAHRLRLQDPLKQWLRERLDEGPPRDSWTRHQRYHSIAILCRHVATATEDPSSPRMDAEWIELAERAMAENQLAHLVVWSGRDLTKVRPKQLAEEWAWVEETRHSPQAELDTRGRAHLYYYRGLLARQRRDEAATVASWQKAIDIDPTPANAALRPLLEIYKSQRNRQAFDALMQRVLPDARR